MPEYSLGVAEDDLLLPNRRGYQRGRMILHLSSGKGLEISYSRSSAFLSWSPEKGIQEMKGLSISKRIEKPLPKYLEKARKRLLKMKKESDDKTSDSK